MKQQTGIGSEQQFSFQMTNSTSVMVGSFLSYPYLKDDGEWVYRNRQHTVAIERYILMLYFKDHKDAKVPHVCVAGQNLHPSSEEWIEYIPPVGDIRYHGMCEIGCDDSTHREF